ncbi:MAG: hypothetical protein NVS9B2_12660 [Steroidobacteraceae bacterium]
MVTSKLVVLALLFVAGTGWSRETASSSSCQSAAARAAIANAKVALDRNPASLTARFNLADAWSDAGCFNDAVQVLQDAPELQSGNKELQTRLRVARSLVGEEIYFEKLDRADAEAKLKRDVFRCSTLSDLDACSEAVRIKPDDATLLVAHGDALVRAKHPAEAIGRYRRAASLVPNQPAVAMKISVAEAQLAALQSSAATPSGAVSGNAGNQGVNARSAAVARTTRKAASTVHMAQTRPRDTEVLHYSNAEPMARSH